MYRHHSTTFSKAECADEDVLAVALLIGQGGAAVALPYNFLRLFFTQIFREPPDTRPCPTLHLHISVRPPWLPWRRRTGLGLPRVLTPAVVVLLDIYTSLLAVVDIIRYS